MPTDTAAMNPPNRPFKLFISYAHDNEISKDRLKIYLSPLVRSCWVELWDDREIPAGADWRAEIEAAMVGSDAAVFLLDGDFLASSFCMDMEVPTFLQNHREKGTLILFVVTDNCGWKKFDYIAQFQLLPRDGRPITSYRPYSKAYTRIAEEIENALAAHQPKIQLPPPPSAAPAIEIAQPEIAVFGLQAAMPAFDLSAEVAAAEAAPEPAFPLARLLEKLPGRSGHLFGREDELAALDAWRARGGVFLWVAAGGMGKSALTRWWLEHTDWPAGMRFLGHSFYSQGSRDQVASARGFLVDTLARLGVEHATDAPDDELGRLLAEEIAKQPTLLALDGIEPLQQLSTDAQLNGSLKDRGLAALLEHLAQKPGAALCLASSRLPIPDPGISDAAGYRQHELATLPPDAAQALLRQRGLRGTDAELAQVAERCGHHALALVLAAEFCHTFLQGEAAAFLARPWPAQAPDAHAATVMAWFDAELAEEQQGLDREIVRILGLFDRPASWGALMALKAAAPIPGLTAQLHAADDAELFESLARLNQWGLVQADLAQAEPDLDAHPLVREHFGAQLQQDAPEAWRAGHRVLYEWFCKLPEKHQPDTLEELEPLYRAVRHGCLAGLYQETLGKVYIDRIMRGVGDDGFYSSKQLGAFGADLEAVICFFVERWRPVTVLPLDAQASLLHHAAFRLRALGRPEESLEPMLVGAAMRVRQKDWESAAISYGSLSELQLNLGRITAAVADAEQSVEYADRSGDTFLRMASRTNLANALYQHGEVVSAREGFAAAEAIQAQRQTSYPQLYSVMGFCYCDQLLAGAEQAAWSNRQKQDALVSSCTEVIKRAMKMLLGSVAHTARLDVAHDYLTLARSVFYTNLLQGRLPSYDAQQKVDLAIAGLRAAGRQDYLPRGLLTRSLAAPLPRRHLRLRSRPRRSPAHRRAWRHEAISCRHRPLPRAAVQGQGRTRQGAGLDRGMRLRPPDTRVGGCREDARRESQYRLGTVLRAPTFTAASAAAFPPPSAPRPASRGRARSCRRPAT
jgi:hypothetical protein